MVKILGNMGVMWLRFGKRREEILASLDFLARCGRII